MAGGKINKRKIESLFNPEVHHFKIFIDKVWLSSPTMHDEELNYYERSI